jgi:hypothetical protein
MFQTRSRNNKKVFCVFNNLGLSFFKVASFPFIMSDVPLESCRGVKSFSFCYLVLEFLQHIFMFPMGHLIIVRSWSRFGSFKYQLMVFYLLSNPKEKKIHEKSFKTILNPNAIFIHVAATQYNGCSAFEYGVAQLPTSYLLSFPL